MAWTVNIFKNTLKMSNYVARKLEKIAEENYHTIKYDDECGKLHLDYDAMEHIDFFYEDWAQEVLDDPSVNGMVIFLDMECGNGEMWGYEFTNGKIHTFKGEVCMKITNTHFITK